MPELILYKAGLEDDDSNVEDAIDSLNRAVGGKNYSIEDGDPEISLLAGEPPYLEVDAGLGKNNPAHSYEELEDVLKALGYKTGKDRDSDLERV